MGGETLSFRLTFSFSFPSSLFFSSLPSRIRWARNHEGKLCSSFSYPGFNFFFVLFSFSSPYTVIRYFEGKLCLSVWHFSFPLLFAFPPPLPDTSDTKQVNFILRLSCSFSSLASFLSLMRWEKD